MSIGGMSLLCVNKQKIIRIIILLIVAVISYASTWVETSAPLAQWGAIASSSSGEFLVAAQSNGYIFTSSNG